MSQIKSAQPASQPAKSRPVILAASGVRKTYSMGDSKLQILSGVDISVREGEFIAIEGRSGSGKSTLLHILGALDELNSGSVMFQGNDIAELSSRKRSALRNTQFGFVFQFYHLLPELNVLENTILSSMIQHTWWDFKTHQAQIKSRALDVLKELGMDHRLKHRPSHLSGGERQRVAIARALMNEPKILFADEPTGNLDYETGRQIMAVLERLHQQKNQTIILVTHDRALAREADRNLVLKDGVLSKAEN